MNKSIFEIHEDTLGKFRFRVRAPNNKIVAIGEGCKTKQGCIHGIEDVKETITEYHDAEIKDFTIGETTLILDKLQFEVKKGSIITFSGRLFGNATGDGVVKAPISIYESDGSFLKKTHLVSGNTNGVGDFKMQWVTKKMDWWDNSIEIYAKFEGTSTLKASHSDKQTILIS
jgi:uncharacterized protein YegP (UPF0339 family)